MTPKGHFEINWPLTKTWSRLQMLHKFHSQFHPWDLVFAPRSDFWHRAKYDTEQMRKRRMSPIILATFNFEMVHCVLCTALQCPDATPLRNKLLCQFLGRLGSNGFQLKWRFGTLGNWKNLNPGGPFWSYQLNSTANSAHLAHFWSKWAGLALLSSW